MVALALLVGATAALVLFARLHLAFSVLVAVTFLTPQGLLVLPHASSYLSLHRFLLLLFVLNLVGRIRRREVDVDALRVTPVQVALIAYAVVTFVIGVLYGNPSVPPTVSVYTWIFIVDQVLMFTIALAVIRHSNNPAWFARVLATVAVVAAAVAVGERFTHHSYTSFIYNQFGQAGAAQNFPLETRESGERVRAAADFALSYAWVATMSIPLVIATFSRARRRLLAYVFPGIVTVSILWTYSRSAYVGVLVMLGLLLIASRFDEKIATVVAAGGLGAMAVLLLSATVGQTFTGGSAAGSNNTREQRLPVVLRDAAERPYIGVGIAAGGYLHGLSSTDSTYLGTYLDTGVVGLSLLIFVLTVALWSVLPALRAPPGIERILGAAALTGIVGSILAAAAYDEYSESAAYRLLWLLVALGIGISERVPQMKRQPRRHPLVRAALPLAGVAAGLALFATVPRFGAVTFQFDAIGPGADAAIAFPPQFVSQTMINTGCSIIKTGARAYPRTRVSCYDLQLGSGAGEFRVQAPTRSEAMQQADALIARARSAVRTLTTYFKSSADNARPTWARTAPFWLGFIGFVLALAPAMPGRRGGINRRRVLVPRTSLR
jgi:hypothetical protein